MEKNISHDGLIKLLMQEEGFPAAFFDTLLPEGLKQRLVLESLEFSKDSYVDDALRQHFSDVVFNVDYKSQRGNKKIQLALLVEHKSSPYRFVSLQVLEYMIAGYKHQLGNRPKGRKPYYLRPIVPLVIYHGQSNWQAKQLDQLFDQDYEAALPYNPRFLFEFRSLTHMNEAEITSIKYLLLRAAIFVLKFSFNPKRMFLNLGLITKTLSPGNSPHGMFVYIFKVLEKTYTKEQILEQIDPTMATEVKSFYDKLIAEGFEKGAEQGIKQGREDEREALILKAHLAGLSIGFISGLVDLPEEAVEAILQKHQ